ncbi:RNA polymerase factor sigma-54 [Mangrovicella endophytica]|uniref:RNA polymerase factor sigma-54 n=1 Tax=Mangrovicella endophytica TaxID=2066697 RepID=UPI000C9DD3FE|nr:RNA polymerase factor sigma-54 [Mangrovicella endophytica]
MLAAKLQMRQTQSLVMTPQLLQSIRLLQYSQVELQSFIDAEIERNPLLERPEGLGGDGAAPAGNGYDGPDSVQPGEAIEAPSSDLRAATGERAPELPSASLRERPPQGLTVQGGTAGDNFIDDLREGKPSLALHAAREIADALPDPVERRLAEALAEHLDEAGYVRLDLTETAAVLGVPTPRLETVLAKLQAEAEPAGLFARDLAECLAIQLRRRGRFDPVMATVLANLDLLARRDFATLRRLTGEDEAGLLDILSEIRLLDPKPGHAFEDGPAEMAAPDVIVTEAPDGSWQVELNPEALPRVLLCNDYVAMVAAQPMPAEERSYLAECQQSAGWLMRSLDQRAKTILKVASEIVRRQDAFLASGIAGLKPLTLMTIADAIGMHESTISRVTANKTIATPRGLYEMKFFFSVAIASTAGGDPHSAESVKHRIRVLIDTETVGAVLSDDDIAARLRREGIDLARRTVAKYREALGIASSIQRRREMNARRLAS